MNPYSPINDSRARESTPMNEPLNAPDCDTERLAALAAELVREHDMGEHYFPTCDERREAIWRIAEETGESEQAQEVIRQRMGELVPDSQERTERNLRLLFAPGGGRDSRVEAIVRRRKAM